MARSRFAARHDDVLRKWGDSVAQLSPGCAYLLGSEGHFIVVGTYTDSPITADTIPSKRTAFTRLSILFRPRMPPSREGNWWRRRVPPPGPVRLLRSRLSP